MAGEATKIPFVEAAAPSTPAANRVVVYAKADGLMYSKDDAGAETLMSSGATGSVATDGIWDAAGDLAVGTGANTAAKLTIGAAGGAVSRVNGAVAWNSGTSNPTAATGDRYWRTDLGLEVYYDGTRWLSTMLYRQSIAGGDDTPLPISTSGGVPGRMAMWAGQYDLWLVDWVVSYIVLTTNDGSNYWSMALTKEGASATTIDTRTSAAAAANTWVTTRTAIGAALGSNNVVLYVPCTKTSAPGNLYIAANIGYRLIVT